MIQPIVAYGHSVLREICTPLENNNEAKLIIQDLKDTVLSIPTAVGLASSQINKPYQVFVISLYGKLQVFINPTIRKRRNKQKSEEGCLSIPKIYSDLIDVRDDLIDVEFYDENFNKQRLKLRGFESTIFQHEKNHLEGILFTDHLTKEGREEIQDKLNDIEKGQIKDVKYSILLKNNSLLTQ